MKRWIALRLRNALVPVLAGLCGIVFCLIAANPAATAQHSRRAALKASERRASSSLGASYLAATATTYGFTRAADYGFVQGAESETVSLVEGSKRAIIETGISESYFAKHFKLVKTMNDPSDRRVEWLFSVNGYEAQLVDAIGFHTTGGKRDYVHGIKNQLYATHEIVKTLSLEQARRILRRCIGRFDSESVTYRTLTVPGKARLYLTGRSIAEREREREREKGREQKPKETEGEDEGHFLYVGFVDVETGKCVKKLGRGSS